LVALETAHLKKEIKIDKANECLRDGPLEKLLGGGVGGGIFEPQEVFFCSSFSS